MTKRFGFTLAEVLITLAIIGVVAAMTLPTLIQKHQKRVLGERYEQSLSILSQGFQKMMADEGVTDFEDTEWYQKGCYSNNSNLYTRPENSNEKTYACSQIAKKYFKIIDTVGYEEIQDILPSLKNASDKQKIASGIYVYNGPEVTSYFRHGYNILSNGMMFYASTIDTNGAAGPNRIGYDVFFIGVTNSGIALPSYITSRMNEIKNLKKELDEYCPQIEDPDEREMCIEDYNQMINNVEEDRPLDKDSIEEQCKLDVYRSCCDAYLYQNGFVMDY